MPQRASLLVLAVTLASSTAVLAQNAPPPPRGNGGGPNNNTIAVAADPGLRAGPADAVGPLEDLETSQWNFLATAHDAQNTVPSFITANGPVRVARFVRDAQERPDGGVHAAASSDTANVTMFARLLAAPTPAPSAAAVRGEQMFNRVSCQSCHTAAQTTGRSEIAALDRVTYRPYTDFALHNMGQRLNDRIAQGDANGANWRTAPLWGLGQRVFFLHDGRTSNLVTAITALASQGSEANTVIGNFNTLSRQDMADLLAFL